MDKKQLRVRFKSLLCRLHHEDVQTRSRRACQHLVESEPFQRAAVVMLYLAMPRELDTKTAILYAWQQGKTVVVPKIPWNDKHMIPVEIQTTDAGSLEVSGLRNPLYGVPVPVEDIDLIVVPGLAFDPCGHRLGRGGGYYDRFLGGEGVQADLCGIGFAEQMADALPRQPHDVDMDFLVTEQGILECNSVHGGK